MDIEIDEVRFKRVDKLPILEQKELMTKGIFDGIVRFDICNGEVINIERSLEMPSYIIRRETSAKLLKNRFNL